MEVHLQSKGNAYTVLLDDGSNYGRLNIIWFKRSPGCPYVICNKMKLLHRVVMSAKDGEIVDHINGNTLDNRRENLRIVTPAQNAWNRKRQGGRAPNTSGYQGVHQLPNGRFFAYISREGKTVNLGRYATAVEAARAYDAKALELRGSWAVLNFPDEAGSVPATAF